MFPSMVEFLNAWLPPKPIWTPPPVPVPRPPVVTRLSVTAVRVTCRAPDPSEEMPPPASKAVLWLMVLPVMASVPEGCPMPPPIRARLPVMRVLTRETCPSEYTPPPVLAPPVVRLSVMRLSVRVPVAPGRNLMPPPMFAVPPWKATLVPAKVLLRLTSTAPPPTGPAG
ncbi:hypothetical protein B6R96_04295 [Streptomyces sp. Sge12]|nr:hypothetical protein B6R96_04295 [Streptomyces sp. Sge12]